MTRAKLKIKKDDIVLVMVGKNKGTRGKVLKVFPSDNKVLVEGVNKVKRNVKATQENPEGSYTKELPIHVSNISLIDPKQDCATRVGYRMNGETKERFAKKSGEIV
jgi:large subunit ribosomal protein L24